MKKQFVIVSVLCFIAMVATACNLFSFIGAEAETLSSEPPPPIAEEVPSAWGVPFRIAGTVIGTIDDCAFDGICALIIDANSVIYNVIYAPGMMMCEGTYDGNAVIGDTVEIYGELDEQIAITICTSPDYYINTLQ